MYIFWLEREVGADSRYYIPTLRYGILVLVIEKNALTLTVIIISYSANIKEM